MFVIDRVYNDGTYRVFEALLRAKVSEGLSSGRYTTSNPDINRSLFRASVPSTARKVSEGLSSGKYTTSNPDINKSLAKARSSTGGGGSKGGGGSGGGSGSSGGGGGSFEEPPPTEPELFPSEPAAPTDFLSQLTQNPTLIIAGLAGLALLVLLGRR